MLSAGEVPSERPDPGLSFLTVSGWMCIVLSGCSPLRVGFALWDPRSNLYISSFPLYCAYDLSLSALTAAAGWGFLGRRRWASLLGSVAAGAMIAIGTGSLLVLRLKYFGWAASGRGPHDPLRFCADHWAFILLNGGLVLAWAYLLSRLIRRPVWTAFPPPARGPAGLLGVFFLSLGACFLLNWWVWASWIAEPPFRL